jgi:SAM-dependent methyltransferase
MITVLGVDVPIIRLAIPIYLPTWLHRQVRLWKHAVRGNGASPVNLWGDRDIEWSFVAAHLPEGPGKALDFGNGGTWLSLIAARRGFHVTALDLEQQFFYWQHPNAVFKQGDVLSGDFSNASFDLIINCSAVEHVGLAGRYGVHEARENGDLEAMTRLKEILRPGGLMLLTVPVGQDAVFAPLCRIYGEKRLPKLLDGFAAETEEYWVKDSDNRWVSRPLGTALEFPASVGQWDPGKNRYALGCFVLHRQT